MIPFDSDRGRNHRRGGRERGGDARDFVDPSENELELNDWGGRLRGPEPLLIEELSDLPGERMDFPDREVAGRDAPPSPRAAWLVAPLMLAAAATGVLFVLRGPDKVFGVVFEVVLALGVLWILISALFPAKADRTCPRCAGKGLVRLDPRSTAGLTCRLCSWSDEHASSFLLAEDEGPFEDIVLHERKHGRGKPRP